MFPHIGICIHRYFYPHIGICFGFLGCHLLPSKRDSWGGKLKIDFVSSYPTGRFPLCLFGCDHFQLPGLICVTVEVNIVLLTNCTKFIDLASSQARIKQYFFCFDSKLKLLEINYLKKNREEYKYLFIPLLHHWVMLLYANYFHTYLPPSSVLT